MSHLAQKVNSSKELAGVSMHTARAQHVGQLIPVSCTPTAFAAGLAGAGAVVGAFGVGYAVGNGIGGN